MAYIVRNEARPDLAAGLSRKALAGAATFLAPILFPTFRVAERGGTIACAQVVRGTAVKNRSSGVALTGTRVAPVDVTYSVNKYEGRDLLDDSDVKDAGGEESALAAAAKFAGYDAIKLYEQDAAATIFTATRYAAATSIVAATPFDALNAAAIAVKDYGRPTLVCSETWLNNFVKISAVSKVLKDLFGHGWFREIHDLGNVNRALGAAFGVDGVVIGDNNFWAVAGGSGGGAYDYTDAAAVVAIRDVGGDPRGTAKKLPTYGFAPTFLPENGSLDEPFEVETAYLPTVRQSAVTAVLHAVPKEINASGAVLVKLPA